VNLHDLFAIAGGRAPRKVALRMPAAPAPGADPAHAGGVEWSYDELLARAAAVAGGLRERGIRRGDRVACMLGNGPELVLLHLALLRLGAALVPINLAYRQREVGHILADAAPRLLVAEAATRAVLEEVPAGERTSLEGLLDETEVASWSRAAGAGVAVRQGFRGPVAATDPAAAAMPAAAAVRAVTAEIMVPPTPASATAAGVGGGVGGDDLAMLLYTSGTTGASKAAMISHNNLLATVTGLLAAWSWSASDVLLLALPLFHVHGLVVGLDCALAAGATIELRRRFDAAAVAAELAAGAATMFFGVPTLYVRLVEALAALDERERRPAGRARFPAVRLCCSGSAPLAPETFAAFRERTGHVILERYGMTETGMILSNPYLGPRVPGQVGVPLPGVSVRLVDEAGQDLPVAPPAPAAPGVPGAPAAPPGPAAPAGPVACPAELPESAAGELLESAAGELLVRGANVFGGYWRAPEKTAASFVHDDAGRRWFRTGDLARQDPRTGAFTLLGRRHELIISGGFNVYPREVEETLLLFPGVREAAVVGRPHSQWGEVPVAFLVVDPPFDPPAALAFCKRQLAGFKVPSAVNLVDALPRNALGKLQKHLLP
jgi:malonyl-CoA/methylmalonyl-CoA synthetase